MECANAAFTQSLGTALCERIRIADGVDHFRNARIRKRFAARPSAAVMIARFERDERNCATCARACCGQRINFGMRATTTTVIPICDHAAVVVGNHATNHRVWFSAAVAARSHAHSPREQLSHPSVGERRLSVGSTR
jgi:hypothetical protein